MRRLRAHHLICMCQFQGMGYNETFASNMDAIIKELKADPMQTVIVQNHMDDICKCCPNRVSDTVCSNSKDACLSRDQSVLDALGLKNDQTYIYQEILKRIEADTPTAYYACCSGCNWNKQGVCSLDYLATQLESILD
ncbi:iron-sulfur binding protein [Lachnospiraceae bacterium KM106-2]|nr:iron-sulfur binding protein [Lachnospiraceae bacterium KM106-2]